MSDGQLEERSATDHAPNHGLMLLVARQLLLLLPAKRLRVIRIVFNEEYDRTIYDNMFTLSHWITPPPRNEHNCLKLPDHHGTRENFSNGELQLDMMSEQQLSLEPGVHAPMALPFYGSRNHDRSPVSGDSYNAGTFHAP